jgi:copper homeostasis protein CutC
MTTASHARDALDEVERLHALATELHDKIVCGQPIAPSDGFALMAAASITRFHVSRTLASARMRATSPEQRVQAPAERVRPGCPG